MITFDHGSCFKKNILRVSISPKTKKKSGAFISRKATIASPSNQDFLE